jgi:hypothetical protein
MPARAARATPTTTALAPHLHTSHSVLYGGQGDGQSLAPQLLALELEGGPYEAPQVRTSPHWRQHLEKSHSRRQHAAFTCTAPSHPPRPLGLEETCPPPPPHLPVNPSSPTSLTRQDMPARIDGCANAPRGISQQQLPTSWRFPSGNSISPPLPHQPKARPAADSLSPARGDCEPERAAEGPPTRGLPPLGARSSCRGTGAWTKQNIGQGWTCIVPFSKHDGVGGQKHHQRLRQQIQRTRSLNQAMHATAKKYVRY